MITWTQEEMETLRQVLDEKDKRIAELEDELARAQVGRYIPMAYPGDEETSRAVYEKMEEIYALYKLHGYRNRIVVCRWQEGSESSE